MSGASRQNGGSKHLQPSSLAQAGSAAWQEGLAGTSILRAKYFKTSQKRRSHAAPSFLENLRMPYSVQLT